MDTFSTKSHLKTKNLILKSKKKGNNIDYFAHGIANKKHCTLNRIGDECHFVVECRLYTQERNELYKLVQDLFPYFTHLSTVQKFIFLIRLDKPPIEKHVCSFISTITEKKNLSKGSHIFLYPLTVCILF